MAEFTKIEIRGGVDVEFRQTNGGKPVVTVVGRKQDVGRVRISSDGRTLVVTDRPQQGWQLFWKMHMWRPEGRWSLRKRHI